MNEPTEVQIIEANFELQLYRELSHNLWAISREEITLVDYHKGVINKIEELEEVVDIFNQSWNAQFVFKSESDEDFNTHRPSRLMNMDSDKITRIHSDYSLFALLKPRIFIDGNKWIVLYGENIQDGVAGCGDSPHEAVLDFNQNWNKKLPAIGGSEDFVIN